jgi:nucleoside-diphosphate-sugar epimerase
VQAASSGSHVVRELRERGHEVGEEWIALLDRPNLRRVIAGCDAVIHIAALYS